MQFTQSASTYWIRRSSPWHDAADPAAYATHTAATNAPNDNEMYMRPPMVRTELRMRHSPSIIPTDRLDRDIYLVLEDFRSGAAWRETDEPDTDFHTVISDLLTGQYDQPLRVVAFNPAEGWSRDASEEVAQELARRAGEEGREISEALQEFIESHTGRAIGVQLALPLRGL